MPKLKPNIIYFVMVSVFVFAPICFSPNQSWAADPSEENPAASQELPAPAKISLEISPPAGLIKPCDSILQEAKYPAFLNPPDPNDPNGFVTDQYPINTETVEAAYRIGLFPWSIDENTGMGKWFSLPERGIVMFSEMHWSSNDLKFLRKIARDPSYKVTENTAFEQVIRACQEMERFDKTTGEKEGQWISEAFVKTWIELFKNGNAHSIEVWHNGKLVAGNYGSFFGGVYSGESMFHLEDNANKAAMFKLIEILIASGHTWMDTQQSHGLSQKIGGRLVSRAEFRQMLEAAHKKNLPFFPPAH